MIRQLIHRLLLRRHFWRYATFSEVAEIYASRTLRLMAISMSMVFMAIFLYQNGYSVQFIAGYGVCFSFFKGIIALPAAKYTALFGPKHGILLSNLLYIPSMVLFASVPQLGLPALVATGILQGISLTLYDICHLTDFSKVKSVEHGGKEIAFMNIFEKIATGLSPLLGGVIALFAGPQATLYVAALLFTIASIPLFKTGEPVPTHQKLVFRGFPWRTVWRTLVAETAVGFDSVASSTVWLLLVALTVLGISGNQVYAELGALISVVLLAALASSYAYGVLIDRRKGGELLKTMVVVNALLHLTRPYAQTPVSVALINATNEVATTGYAMSFVRGIFDTADLSGHRVTYIGLIEIALNVGMAAAAGLFLFFVSFWEPTLGMKLFFFVAAPVTLLIATPKFRLYRK
ncbi:MAG TPA: MFS transporter [Candidatus Saccharimonadales bacterium]|nr:MFS transporter [Candidatus Saccharimonadales bacterium]